jgi:thiol:disulfide interchange protein DsbC
MSSFLLFGANVDAQPANPQLKSTLQAAFPEIVIDSVQPSPINGLYEVTAGSTIFYSNADGSHIVYGDMLHVKGKDISNLTENKRKASRAKTVQGISDETTIIYPAKRPKYILTVFTDTDCGYCRRFHQDIAELNKQGVTVRYVAFPREGKNSATYKKMVSIWCSKDRQKAMNDAKNGLPVPAINCDHPIDMHMEIVETLGLKGTPTLLMSDGTMLPGYLPPPALLAQLQKVNADIH